ncbi:MLH3 [Mytilus edulis]|uniref:MLH3 n=1 Tax=Mytilus edulis TaxID=6550 RepID=A0A8S3TN51_MYTED|nr:MLH3 [Mytilus edulis]
MGDRIASLPADVRSLLRTGVAITNVAQCVEELVVNALDAGATCVAIRVDLPCFKIQVVDNGKGIRQDDLQVVGERYSTSKCHEVSDLENLHYYGYRGEALASLRDITSILEINSRSQTSTHTFCKIFQQGRPLPISDSTVPRSSAGTTVTVHDLFYNLPVRKKCCNPALDLEKIRQKVENFVGLKLKPEISTKDRNGLFSKIVKRKVITDISSSSTLSESPDTGLTSDEKESNTNDKNDTIDMLKNDELFTPLDQQMKVTTPGSPRPDVLNPTIEIKSNRNGSIRLDKEISKDNTMSKRKDSCSDGDLSEDPIPTQQRVKMAVKKNIICIDTPIVRETKINVSSLSKLRKRKSSENSTLLTKSLQEKQKKFTKLKEQRRDTAADTLEYPDFKSNNCSTEFGEIQTDVPVFTSSLQGLRKLRSKEPGSVKGQISEHSLQVLKKFRSQSQVRKVNQVTNQPINHTQQGNDRSGTLSRNCEDKSERIVTNADPAPGHFVENAPIKHVKQTHHDIENLVEDGKSDSSASVSNLTSLKPHEKFQCQPVRGKGVDEERSNDQAISLKYTDTNKEIQHELQPSTSTDFSMSSPIDIEEACESIENCVAEIENIISKSNNRSYSMIIPQETFKFSPSREYENFTTISGKKNSKPKSFMSSDSFIQTVHSFLPTEGSQSFNTTQSPPFLQASGSDSDKQGINTIETKQKSTDDDLFYTTSPPHQSVRQISTFTFNQDSSNQPSSSHIATVHNPHCGDHLSDTDFSLKNKAELSGWA